MKGAGPRGSGNSAPGGGGGGGGSSVPPITHTSTMDKQMEKRNALFRSLTHIHAAHAASNNAPALSIRDARADDNADPLRCVLCIFRIDFILCARCSELLSIFGVYHRLCEWKRKLFSHSMTKSRLLVTSVSTVGKSGFPFQRSFSEMLIEWEKVDVIYISLSEFRSFCFISVAN